MEWWKLFSGTFILIFLAELGDKTQLAAMAKTADSPDSSSAKWVVFLAASLALATSTFIAVFLGHVLKALVPDERYIKLAAGALFLIFGFTILYETAKSYRVAPAPAPEVPVSETEAGHGLAGELALRAALDFEELSVRRYQAVAERAGPELRSLLCSIADEEADHLRRLRGLSSCELRDAVRGAGVRGTGASGRTIFTADSADAKVLGELIAQEEATAAFYRDLSDRALIGSVKAVLRKLADEETGHARRLREALPGQIHHRDV